MKKGKEKKLKPKDIVFSFSKWTQEVGMAVSIWVATYTTKSGNISLGESSNFLKVRIKQTHFILERNWLNIVGSKFCSLSESERKKNVHFKYGATWRKLGFSNWVKFRKSSRNMARPHENHIWVD